MNKHTPTPWHVDKIIRTMVRDATKLIVCRCESSYSADDDIRIANTEYIVKCVNLISELEQKGITLEQLEKLASGELALQADNNVGSWQPSETGRWSYNDDNVEENGVDIYVYGDEWVATTYPNQASPSVQRIRATQLVNYANNYETIFEENTRMRDALETISYHAEGTPSDFDISVVQNIANQALQQTKENE